MKRYLIFAALGPLLGGFLLLVATTVMSGYWHQADLSEVAKLFVVFLKTLQYSYLFGILPALMIGAHWLGGPDAGCRRDRVSRRRTSLRLARTGQRRNPVLSVWTGRLHPGDDLVVAGS